jgi:hypothetical protein
MPTVYLCVCVYVWILWQNQEDRDSDQEPTGSWRWTFQVHLRKLSYGDWRCSSERGIDLSNVKWVLTAVGIPNTFRYYCTLYQESLPLYPNCNPGFGVLGNVRNFIPIHLWTIRSQQAEIYLEDKTDPLVRRWPQGTANHIVVDWRGGASELVPMQCSQSEKLLLWHHRGLTGPGSMGGLSLLLACCYGSIGSKARRTLEEMPL